MPKLTTQEIIELLGGITVVARMLDIKPPSVHAWLKDGIPDARLVAMAAQIELKSGGRFSRKQHWPEKYSIYWPELDHPTNLPPVDAETVPPNTPVKELQPVTQTVAVLASLDLDHTDQERRDQARRDQERRNEQRRDEEVHGRRAANGDAVDVVVKEV